MPRVLFQVNRNNFRAVRSFQKKVTKFLYTEEVKNSPGDTPDPSQIFLPPGVAALVRAHTDFFAKQFSMKERRVQSGSLVN